jgi:bifunctional DNA-binding transcriptional regulator/antitoxin component of YhaV-PrlF toxin-antitoxin module
MDYKMYGPQNMHDPSRSVEVLIDHQGSVVIPEALMERLGFAEGDTLLAHGEMGRLVLEQPAALRQRLKARFAQVPGTRSLADELIAERREAAKQDEND